MATATSRQQRERRDRRIVAVTIAIGMVVAFDVFIINQHEAFRRVAG